MRSDAAAVIRLAALTALRCDMGRLNIRPVGVLEGR
jgi:hypothetical protein